MRASVLPFDASAFMDAPTPAIYHPTDAGPVTLHTIAETSGPLRHRILLDAGPAEERRVRRRRAIRQERHPVARAHGGA